MCILLLKQPFSLIVWGLGASGSSGLRVFLMDPLIHIALKMDSIGTTECPFWIWLKFNNHKQHFLFVIFFWWMFYLSGSINHTNIKSELIYSAFFFRHFQILSIWVLMCFVLFNVHTWCLPNTLWAFSCSHY